VRREGAEWNIRGSDALPPTPGAGLGLPPIGHPWKECIRNYIRYKKDKFERERGGSMGAMETLGGGMDTTLGGGNMSPGMGRGTPMTPIPSRSPGSIGGAPHTGGSQMSGASVESKIGDSTLPFVQIDRNREPDWDDIYYYLRTGCYREAYDKIREFNEEHSGLDTSSNSPNPHYGQTRTPEGRTPATPGSGSGGKYRVARSRSHDPGQDKEAKIGIDGMELNKKVQLLLQAFVYWSGVQSTDPQIEGAEGGVFESDQNTSSVEQVSFYEIESAADWIISAYGEHREQISNQISEQQYQKKLHYDYFYNQKKGKLHGLNVYKECVLHLVALIDDDDTCEIIAKIEGEDLKAEDVTWSYCYYIYWKNQLLNPPLDRDEAHQAALMIRQDRHLLNHLSSQGHMVDALYSKILDWGGHTHFDPGQVQPYEYARILLHTHNFLAAISYLFYHEQLDAATHLACVCLYYGLISPEQYLVDEMRIEEGNRLMVEVVSTPISITNLIENYINEKGYGENNAGEMSLHYLLMLILPQHPSLSTTDGSDSSDESSNNFDTFAMDFGSFIRAVERLFLNMDTWDATSTTNNNASSSNKRRLIEAVLRTYIKRDVYLVSLIRSLGHRALSLTYNMSSAFDYYILAERFNGASHTSLTNTNSATTVPRFGDSLIEVLESMIRLVSNVIVPRGNLQHRRNIRDKAKKMLYTLNHTVKTMLDAVNSQGIDEEEEDYDNNMNHILEDVMNAHGETGYVDMHGHYNTHTHNVNNGTAMDLYNLLLPDVDFAKHMAVGIEKTRYNRICQLCLSLHNLETCAQLMDYFALIDSHGDNNKDLDVNQFLVLYLSKMVWKYPSNVNPSYEYVQDNDAIFQNNILNTVEEVLLLPFDDHSYGKAVDIIPTLPDVLPYMDCILHSSSYMKRLRSFVGNGLGSSFSVNTDTHMLDSLDAVIVNLEGVYAACVQVVGE
jgi:hypothetical protein